LQEVQAVAVVSLVVQEERVVLMVQLAHLLVVLAVQVAQVEQHY
jgi:hypothetical protein